MNERSVSQVKREIYFVCGNTFMREETLRIITLNAKPTTTTATTTIFIVLWMQNNIAMDPSPENNTAAQYTGPMKLEVLIKHLHAILYKENGCY